MVEEGAKRLFPSSFEILFPQSKVPTTFLNVTLDNMKLHAKQHRTPRKNTTKQPQKHHTETKTAAQPQTEKPNFHHENFFLHSY